MIVTAGSTNISVYFYIVQDASATSPGEPVTGLLFSDIETGGSASYVRQGALRTDLTLITLSGASATHADGGFILVDDTNMPGLYRCDYADATFATGVDQVMLQIVVASGKNAVASPIFVDITDVDLRDSVRGGMTSLPNAAADAVGGLPISDAGGLDLDTKLANTNEITVARMGALTDWIDGGRLDLLIDDIPTTAEFEARTLIAASYFDPAADAVATVTTLTNKTGFSLAATGLDAISQASTGMIEIAKAVWDRLLTGATHNIMNSAGRRVRDLQEFGVYEGGAVYIDTVNGTPGTTIFESGTVFNPVKSLADALIIATDTNLNLIKFEITAGSTITFVSAHNNHVFLGHGWTLNLGGQDIANTRIEGAKVSGIGTGTGTQFFFECLLLGVTMPDDTHLIQCGIGGTQTLPAGDIFYERCHSGVPGGVAPIFDFGAATLNTDLNILHYGGDIEIQNLGQAGTDVACVAGDGNNIIVNANSIGGILSIAGNWDLTYNGTPTINDSARYN